MPLNVLPRHTAAVARAWNLREIHAVLLGNLASGRCRTGWDRGCGECGRCGGCGRCGCRRCRRTRTLRTFRTLRTLRTRPRLYYPQHLADLHVLAVLAGDLREHAGRFGADLEIDLVGLELDEHVAGGDAVSLVFHPARDARFDHRFTELRNDDIHMGNEE